MHPTKTPTNRAQRRHSDEWLGPDELGAWLGIPVATIYQWRARRTGPVAHRIGRHLRYRLSDVESWLAQQVD